MQYHILAYVQTTANPKPEQAAIDAEARYRRARLISNLGFVAGGMVLFFSLWYIVGKGTSFDLGLMVGSLLGSNEKPAEFEEAPYLAGLDLEPLDPKRVPPIFLDEPPPPPTVAARPPQPDPAEERQRQEQKLKEALNEANHQFRSWQFPQAEKSYMAVIKVLPRDRALKLQKDVCTMFFKRGVRFYKEKRYTKALDVLRIALHFDPNNRLAHQYLARCYRLLGKGGKAKYHERMVAKLKKRGH